jgi:hypothetical protein
VGATADVRAVAIARRACPTTSTTRRSTSAGTDEVVDTVDEAVENEEV